MTGKRSLYGNSRSKSLKAVRRVFKVNLLRLRLPFLNRMVGVKISADALRTVKKFGGLGPFLKGAKAQLLSLRMRRLKGEILRKSAGECESIS